MNISWLRLNNVVESCFKTFILNMYSDMCKLTVFDSELYINLLSQRIKNPFWKDVLRHLKNLCTKSTPQNVDEFMSECIHYNANILRDQKVLYINNWVDNGILYIRQMTQMETSYLLMNLEDSFLL